MINGFAGLSGSTAGGLSAQALSENPVDKIIYSTLSPPRLGPMRRRVRVGEILRNNSDRAVAALRGA
jgi:hypothetical protein